jgi:hypothetical protein
MVGPWHFTSRSRGKDETARAYCGIAAIGLFLLQLLAVVYVLSLKRSLFALHMVSFRAHREFGNKVISRRPTWCDGLIKLVRPTWLDSWHIVICNRSEEKNGLSIHQKYAEFKRFSRVLFVLSSISCRPTQGTLMLHCLLQTIKGRHCSWNFSRSLRDVLLQVCWPWAGRARRRMDRVVSLHPSSAADSPALFFSL